MLLNFCTKLFSSELNPSSTDLLFRADHDSRSQWFHFDGNPCNTVTSNSSYIVLSPLLTSDLISFDRKIVKKMKSYSHFEEINNIQFVLPLTKLKPTQSKSIFLNVDALHTDAEKLCVCVGTWKLAHFILVQYTTTNYFISFLSRLATWLVTQGKPLVKKKQMWNYRK